MIQDKMFPLVEDLLTLTFKRRQALTSNVANVNTPDYRAKDFSFSEQLNSLDMLTTSAKHIKPAVDGASNTRMFEVGTAEKPNGNNVDLERELAEITKNELQYVMLVQCLNQKIRTLRSSITEEGKV